MASTTNVTIRDLGTTLKIGTVLTEYAEKPLQHDSRWISGQFEPHNPQTLNAVASDNPFPYPAIAGATNRIVAPLLSLSRCQR